MNAIAQPETLRARVEGEVDLFQLLVSLWQFRVMIGFITLLTGLLSALYAYTATRTYSVQSVVRPAAVRDLDELNQFGLYTLSPQDALHRVGAALDSYDTRLSFYREHSAEFEALKEPLSTLEQTFERFNERSFHMLWPSANERASAVPFVGIRLSYPEGLDGAGVVNKFVVYAQNRVRQQVATDLETIISNRLAQLDQQINASRASYEASKEAQIAELREADNLKIANLNDELVALRQELSTRRLNRIKQLDENIGIAKSLGIAKPSTPSSLGDKFRANQNIVRTEINNQQLPLYFMGSEALGAERNALARRVSDDFTEPRILQIKSELELLKHNRQIEALRARDDEDLFLSNLAKIREEATRLRLIDFDANALKLVSIDQAAVPPVHADSPNSELIIVLGALLGAGAGIALATAVAHRRQRRQRFSLST